ncbi:hypothetical protein AB0I92_19550 [Micromonospora chalcea]|uniref:hypothetical protein n=1 Tax=Micromonospora chalcea TaxID=1874 RepID=UPI0033E323D0
MDADISGLAAAGASAIIGAMATDAWKVAKQGFARIFSRSQPQALDAVAAELEQSREDVLAADDETQGGVLSSQEDQWKARLRMLLITDPTAVGELQKVLDAVAVSSVDGRSGNVTLKAEARDFGRVYQQGSGIQFNA